MTLEDEKIYATHDYPIKSYLTSHNFNIIMYLRSLIIWIYCNIIEYFNIVYSLLEFHVISLIA